MAEVANVTSKTELEDNMLLKMIVKCLARYKQHNPIFCFLFTNSFMRNP